MKTYAVSFGNGNDGVSSIYPAYYVTTDDPFRLCELALLSEFKPEGRDWARDAMDIDGEADYGVSGTIHEGPGGETEFGAAWLICEVTPENDEAWLAKARAPKYDSLEDCFSAEELADVAAN